MRGLWLPECQDILDKGHHHPHHDPPHDHLHHDPPQDPLHHDDHDDDQAGSIERAERFTFNNQGKTTQVPVLYLKVSSFKFFSFYFLFIFVLFLVFFYIC